MNLPHERLDMSTAECVREVTKRHYKPLTPLATEFRDEECWVAIQRSDTHTGHPIKHDWAIVYRTQNRIVVELNSKRLEYLIYDADSPRP